MARLITIAMATYGQPQMLAVWFDTLWKYSPGVLDQLELVIVDDCGDPPAEIPLHVQDLLPCQLFRVTKDIPWNQPGARNLAAEHVRTPLLLFVDPDMVFSEEMMRRLLGAGSELRPNQVLRFCLKHRSGRSKGEIDKTSPNTWFLHTDAFRKVRGYDEDFCGHKGWSDVQLLDLMKAAYKVVQDTTIWAEFYSTAEIEDAAVMKLDRDVKHNKYLRIGKIRQANLMGGWVKYSKTGKRLRFPWEQIL